MRYCIQGTAPPPESYNIEGICDGTTTYAASSEKNCQNQDPADRECSGEGLHDNQGHIMNISDDEKRKDKDEPGVDEEEDIGGEEHSALVATGAINPKPALVEEDGTSTPVMGENVNSKSHDPVGKDDDSKQQIFIVGKKQFCDADPKHKLTDGNRDTKCEKSGSKSGEKDDEDSKPHGSDDNTTLQMKPKGDRGDHENGKELAHREADNNDCEKLTGHGRKRKIPTTTSSTDNAVDEETNEEGHEERFKKVTECIENENGSKKHSFGSEVAGGGGGTEQRLSGKNGGTITTIEEDCREKTHNTEDRTCRETRLSRRIKNTMGENMSQSEACITSSVTENSKQDLQSVLIPLLCPSKTLEKGESEDMQTTAADGEGSTNSAAAINKGQTHPVNPMNDAGEDDWRSDWWPSGFMYGSNLLPVGELVNMLGDAKGLVDSPCKHQEEKMDEYAAIANNVFGRWDLQHADTCTKCGDGGKVYCCDFCHLVFHLNCVDRLQRHVIESSPLFACEECKKEAQEAFSDAMKYDVTRAYHKGNSPQLVAFLDSGRRPSLPDVVSDFLEATSAVTGNELQIISNSDTTSSTSTETTLAGKEIWQPLPYGHPPLLPHIVLKLWFLLQRCKSTWQPTLLKPLPTFGSWSLHSLTTIERKKETESIQCLLTVAEISFTRVLLILGNPLPTADGRATGAELLLEVDYMMSILNKHFMSYYNISHGGNDLESRTNSPYPDVPKPTIIDSKSNIDYMYLRLIWLEAHRLMVDNALTKNQESLHCLNGCLLRLKDMQLSIGDKDGVGDDYPEVYIPLFHAHPGPLHPICISRANELVFKMREKIAVDRIITARDAVMKCTVQGLGREDIVNRTKQVLLGLSSRYDKLQINATTTSEIGNDSDCDEGKQLSSILEIPEDTADEILSDILKKEGEIDESRGLQPTFEAWKYSGKCDLSDGIGTGSSSLSMLLWASAKLGLWGQVVSFAIDLLCRLGTCLLVSQKTACIITEQQHQQQQLSNFGPGSQLEKVREKKVDDEELLPSFQNSLLGIVSGSSLTAEALCGLLSMCISSALKSGNRKTVLLAGHSRLVRCIGWVMRLAGIADEYGEVFVRQGQMICNNAMALISSPDRANELKHWTLKGCAGAVIEIASVGIMRGGKAFSYGAKLKRCSTAIDALEAFHLSSENGDCHLIGSGVKESNPNKLTNCVPFPPSTLQAIIFAGISVCEMAEQGKLDRNGCPLVVSGIIVIFHLLSNQCLFSYLPRNVLLLAGSSMHSYLAERGICNGNGGSFLTELCNMATDLQSDPSLDITILADQIVAQCHKCLYGISLGPSTEKHINSAACQESGGIRVRLHADIVKKVWPIWESMLQDTSKPFRSKGATMFLEAIESIDEFKDPPLTNAGTIIQDYLFGYSWQEESRELLLNRSRNLLPEHVKRVLSLSSSGEEMSVPKSHLEYHNIYQSLYFHLARTMGGIAFGKRKRGQSLLNLEEGLQAAVWWHIKDLNFNPQRATSWHGLSCCLFALLGIVLDVYPVSCHDLGIDNSCNDEDVPSYRDNHLSGVSSPTALDSFASLISWPQIPEFVSKGLGLSPLFEDLSGVLNVSLIYGGEDYCDNIPLDKELHSMASEGFRRAMKRESTTASYHEACNSSTSSSSGPNDGNNDNLVRHSIPDGDSIVKEKNDGGGCDDEKGTKHSDNDSSCIPLTQHCVIMSLAILCARAHIAWAAVADKEGNGDSSLHHAYESEASYLFVLARDVFHPSIVKGADADDIRTRLLEKAEVRLSQASDTRNKFVPSFKTGEEGTAAQLREHDQVPSWHIPFMRAKIGLKLGKPFKQVLSYVLEAQELAGYEKPFMEDDARDSCFQFLHSLRGRMAMEAEPSDEVLSLLEDNAYNPVLQAEDQSSIQSLPPHLIRAQRQRAVVEDVLRAMEEAMKRNKWSHRPMMCRAKCLLFLFPTDLRPAKIALSPLFDRHRILQVVSVWREEGPVVKWKACEQAGRKFHWIRRRCIIAWLDIVGCLTDTAAIFQLLYSARHNKEKGDLAPWAASLCSKLLLILLQNELEQERHRTQDAEDNNKTGPDFQSEKCENLKEVLSQVWEVYLAEIENYPLQAECLLCTAYAQYIAAISVCSDAGTPQTMDLLPDNGEELLKVAQQTCNKLFPNKVLKMKIAKSKLPF